MNRSIVQLAFLVRDYDEAIRYFIDKLRFNLLEDTPLDGGKRWVVVSPSDLQGSSLLLAKASNPEQLAYVGKQGGGRVFLFLHTSDFWADYRHMQARGVQFAEEPRDESYGLVAVFYDLYGNKWDLVQPVHT